MGSIQLASLPPLKSVQWLPVLKRLALMTQPFEGSVITANSEKAASLA